MSRIKAREEKRGTKSVLVIERDSDEKEKQASLEARLVTLEARVAVLEEKVARQGPK